LSPGQKELRAFAQVTEDGKKVVFTQKDESGKTRVFLQDIATGKRISLEEKPDGYHSAVVIGDSTYIHTTRKASMGKVIVATKEGDRKELIGEDPNFKIEKIVPAAKSLFLVGLQGASSEIRVYSIDGQWLRSVTLPDYGTADVIGSFKGKRVFISFESFFSSKQIFEYDIEKDLLTLLKSSPLKVDTSEFQCRQQHYISRDETQVFMYVLSSKNAKGEAPTMLFSHEGFGSSFSPTFLPACLVWLEAGGAVAFPSIRGGGEYGEKWRESAKRENRQRATDDLIAAAEWLIVSKQTSPSKLGMMASGAGGLTAACALVQRPELFQAVILKSPLTDMIRYHKYDGSKANQEELGTVVDVKMFPFLYKTSPYHNVREREYPSVLISCSAQGGEFDALHARKMVVALQEATRSSNPILYFNEDGKEILDELRFVDRLKYGLYPFFFAASELGLQAKSETWIQSAKTVGKLANTLFFRYFWGSS
jgi:prolyl oligopeptidase